MISEIFAEQRRCQEGPAGVIPLVLYGTGIFLVTSAVVAMWGWSAGNESLLLVLAGNPTMRFNTAVSIGALGVALWATAAHQRWVASLLGAIVGLLAGATLWQRVVGFDLDIDQRLMVDFLARRGNAPDPEHPGRMAVSTAICLICLGTSLLVNVLDRLRHFAALLAAVAAFLSLVSLLSLAFSLGVDGQYWLATGSGAPAAILLAAGAFAILFWLISAPDGEFGHFVAIGAGLGAFALVLIAWQALKDSENEAERASLAVQAEVAREAVEGVVEANAKALERMAGRLRRTTGRSQIEWEMEAADYLKDLPGIESIGWIDQSDSATTILPRNDPASLRTMRRSQFQYLADLAQRAVVSPRQGLTNSPDPSRIASSGRLLAVAAIDDGRFIAASFSTTMLLDVVLRRESRTGMLVELEPLLPTGDAANERDVGRGPRLPLSIGGQQWEFRLAAAETPKGHGWAGGRAGLVLWGGALFSLTLLFAVDRAFYARLRAAQADRQRVALSDSEAKYRTLVDTMGEGVTVVQDERVAFANPAIARMMGYAPEEMIGLHFSRTFTSESASLVASRHRERINSVGAIEPPQRYEVQLVRKDGSVFWAELDARRTEFHGRTAVTALFRDVDERRRSETRLKAEKQRIELVLKGSVDGIWDWSADGDLYTFSDRCFELLGYVREDTRPDREGWIAHVYPADRARLISQLSRHIANHETFDLECRLLSKSGAFRWFRVAGQADWDESGAVTRMAGSLSDIEQRKAAEIALTVSEARFRGAMEHSAIGMALVSLDGRWLEVNAAVCEIVGYSPTELKRLTFQDITYRDDLDTDMAYVTEMLAGKRTSYRMEKRYTRKDGTLVWVLLAVSLARDADGAPEYFISQIEDIDQRKRQEDLLKKALNEKELLLREVYHRVKNNLQVVYSMLSIQGRALGEGAGGAALSETAARVRAMALVHDRLYRSGTVESMPVRDFVEELIANVKESAGADHSRVRVEAEIEEVTVGLDVAIPLGLLVNELVTNSIKHAFPNRASGKVTVCLYRVADAVELRVTDNGVGVESAKQSGPTKSMGLRLAAALARQLGGVLESHSEGGAAFSVRFNPQHA